MGRQRNIQDSEAAGVTSVTPVAPSLSVQESQSAPPVRRSAKEICDQFLADISTHPDAKVMVLGRSGTPDQGMAMRHLPINQQTIFECKLLVKR